jgi:hypothetical protein
MTNTAPWTGDEKAILRSGLDRHRDAALWKLEGLDEEQARRRMTPSGTSPLGLVKHLAAVDYWWFCVTFGQDTEPLPFVDDDPDADLRVDDGESVADVVAFYGRARAAADEVLARLPLDEVATSEDGRVVSLRWVAVHMIEETARHVGHLDILRELIDGATGDHRRFAAS